jgi:hypothetical protein
MRRWALIAAAMLASGAAAAPVSVPEPQLTLTVYNSNLAMVQDVRHLDVPAGRTRLEFKDVSAGIKPETVALGGSGISVVEQNFDYDLLTPAKMMEKAVGRQIQIVRTNPGTGAQTTETATVLSVNEGVVLKIGNRIEVLRDDGIPTRVVFSSIPENLRPQPTLSVTVNAASAGPRDVTLSYLTLGLSWQANYVALYDEKQKALGLSGWITLTNKSGTSFMDVRTQLVAGNITLAENGDDYWARELRRRSATRNGGYQPSTDTSVGDYDIFTLPERVTIAENQTKQVAFLDMKGLKTEKAYEYRSPALEGNGGPDHADVVLKFSNKERGLPAGVVRVYMRDQNGEPKFVGEDEVDQTPSGSDLAVKIGEAFDVTVQSTTVSTVKLGAMSSRISLSYVLRNARDEAVTVDLRQGGLLRGAKVVTESQPSTRIDARTLGWSIVVPAHGETTLTVTADSGN